MSEATAIRSQKEVLPGESTAGESTAGESTAGEFTAGGFTLLEMILCISIFLLLMTAAFSLVGATSELMAEVSEVQNDSAVRLRFLEVCRTAFESADATSSIAFDYSENSFGVNTYLSLVNAPTAFDFGVNLEDEIDRVVLAAEIIPPGEIRSRVYYMTALDYEEARQSNFDDIRAPYVELVRGMRMMSWFFFDSRSGEWVQRLEDAQDVSLIKLAIRMEQNSPTLESAFYFVGSTGGGFPGQFSRPSANDEGEGEEPPGDE